MVLGTAVVGFAGLGLATAGPALAEPGTTYVVTGSNTIQDLMNTFSTTTDGLLGSYNALDPVTNDPASAHQDITVWKNSGTTQTSYTLGRPNGSGDGLKALLCSLGGPDCVNYGGTTPPAGATDVGRSSGDPGSTAKLFATTGQPSAVDPAGQLVFVPFAYDNMTDTAGSAVQGVAQFFSKQNLTDLYNCNPTTVTTPSGDVTVTPEPPTTAIPAGTSDEVHMYVPQSGSGSRNFWLEQFSNNTLEPCVSDNYPGTTGSTIEENNGTILQDDANAIFPFSVGQWLFQQSHAGQEGLDVRNGAILLPVNGIQPTTGTVGSDGLIDNPTGQLTTPAASAFPVFRELYNILQYSRIAGTSPSDPTLAGLFAGSSSALCSSGSLIQEDGFVPLGSRTPLAPDTCGSTADSLRAYPNL